MAAYAFAGWFLWLALWPVAGWSQNVYRCDSSYSPAQCDGAKLKVDDVRTKEQKRDADKATRKISNKANAMEKARQKEEAAILAQRKREMKAAAKVRAQDAAKLKALESKKITQQKNVLRSAPAVVKAKKPKMFVAKVIKPITN